MNGTVMEELAASKDRLGAPDLDGGAHEVTPSSLLVGQLPMEPGELVILAIRVVVPLLRLAELVAGQEHGDALRHHQRRQEIALLLPAQGVDGGIVGWALGPTVPTVVLIGAVLVLVAIRVVMLVIVTDQVVQREAVMASDKIDAGQGLAPVMLIQIAAAAQSGGKL